MLVGVVEGLLVVVGVKVLFKVINVGVEQGCQGGRDLKVVIMVVKVGNMVNMEYRSKWLQFKGSEGHYSFLQSEGFFSL